MQNRSPSILENLQREVYRHIRQFGGFRGLPIHIGAPSDFGARVQQQARESSGLQIHIHPPIPLRIEEGLAGPLFDELDLCVEVLEHAVSNDSGWSAIAVAEELCRQLHGLPLPAPALQGQLVCRTEKPWEYFFEDGRNRLRLHFTATATF